MLFCRPEHESSVINIAFHPKTKYLCSASCDGKLHIYKMPDEQNTQPKKVYERKLCEKTNTESA